MTLGKPSTGSDRSLRSLYHGGVKVVTKTRLTVAGTVGVAATAVWMSALATLDLLNFTQTSQYDVIELAANSFLWGWIFAFTAVFLIAALIGRRWGMEGKACSLAAAFFLTWSFFTLLWGLSTDHPVSLASPGLAVFVAIGAQILAVDWNRQARHESR